MLRKAMGLDPLADDGLDVCMCVCVCDI